MSLEAALQEQEEKVNDLLKAATKYVGALKGWQKACQIGHIANMQKAAAQAEELCSGLPETTSTTRNAWEYDVRGYLASDAWIQEIQSLLLSRHNLQSLIDDGVLISSPVAVSSAPHRNTLLLGKINLPTIRPTGVAAELKRLRDRTENANPQDFVESLFRACVYLSSKEDPHARFQDIYTLFCLTPGYKKENPPAVFGQQIYGLHRSEVRTTRAGRKLEIEYASGNVKEKDIFTVVAEDGRQLRYYNIFFK